MSESHTKGPWIVAEGDFSTSGNVITTVDRLTNEQVCIAEIETDYLGPIGSEQLANARLIKAAPDLLSELENCVDVLSMFFPSAPLDSCIGAAIIKARAAIARTEGGAP